MVEWGASYGLPDIPTPAKQREYLTMSTAVSSVAASGNLLPAPGSGFSYFLWGIAAGSSVLATTGAFAGYIEDGQENKLAHVVATREANGSIDLPMPIRVGDNEPVVFREVSGGLPGGAVHLVTLFYTKMKLN